MLTMSPTDQQDTALFQEMIDRFLDHEVEPLPGLGAEPPNAQRVLEHHGRSRSAAD